MKSRDIQIEGQNSHYHRRGKINQKTGQPAEGQGKKRHRPWDNKPSDKNFWDRF
jgi:hypothetical protein